MIRRQSDRHTQTECCFRQKAECQRVDRTSLPPLEAEENTLNTTTSTEAVTEDLHSTQRWEIVLPHTPDRYSLRLRLL